MESVVKKSPSKEELFSRSKGILEHTHLLESKVLIVGLGSFGGNVCIELAKVGIGNFYLIDFDKLELANISRHQCGISDLGKYKTKAVADLIHNKNPYAKVHTHEININEHMETVQEIAVDVDLILCLTDENQSRSRINQMGLDFNKTVIFGRAITRAEAGDVFILNGDDKTKPCLACLIGMGLFKYADDERTQFNDVREEAPAYVSDEDVEATIQVGLSSDISPITNMIVKLSLLELCRGQESGLTSLYEDLTSEYYLWVNRREDKYKDWLPMKNYANQPSILRWYGVTIEKGEDCMACNLESLVTSSENGIE